ncbi:hypothetical protein BSKO_08688 [Bryopsis sp. KO-2023]|nr:hypothetical protein BSKO_08688 [Bryopsis sp. KO-2023]
MVKQNMSTIDVAAEVACLRHRVMGMWVINVYDISSKTYLLKLGTSGEAGEKVFLVMESGARFHTTQYDRGRKDFPSNFCLKLRKHVRGRRLNDVQQLGIDRIIDFSFGHGENTTHLILELYAQGNIVLTDSSYEVLTLLRSHRDDDKGYALMPRHPYPVHAIRLSKGISLEDVENAIESAEDGVNLKSVIGSVMPYGASIAEHCIRTAALDPSLALKSKDQVPLTAEEVSKLVTAIQTIENWLKECWEKPPKGFLFQKVNAAETQYQDYVPISLEQNSKKAATEFDSFDAALDEYYSKIEGQKADVQQKQAEKVAVNRVEKTKKEQEKRAAGLHKAAEHAELQASTIEFNLDVVDAAIGAVNEVVATGMAWKDVENLIKEEAEGGNPIAGLIHSLQLDKNSITLLLEQEMDVEEEEEEEEEEQFADEKNPKKIKVQVDLGLSAFGNASMHYGTKKENIRKEQRTHQAKESALKASEKKALAKLKQQQNVVAPLHQLRKPHWFEKFHWFISSENYIVISGRDAQQNDLVVKRYMEKDDLYVHADTHGAASTIIKNHQPEHPIPPLTLQQAGAACVCRSKAWDGKIVTSAWWVYADQVSKTAPTGEYLSTGGFMIRGKKNFLPAAGLVFGFGYMFRLEESCIEDHRGERAPRNFAVEDSPREGAKQKEEEVASSSSQPADKKSEVEASNGLPPSVTESSNPSVLDSFLDEATDFLSASHSGLTPTVSGARPAPVRAHPGGTSASFEQEGPDLNATKPKGKKRMSKKERQALKKGSVGFEPEEEEAAPDPDIAAEAVEESAGSDENEPTPLEQQPPLQPPNQLKARPRGGKGKKSKYDDWDEEDRELMMQFLGAGGEKKSRSDRRAERKKKQAAKRSEQVSKSLGAKQGDERKKDMQETIAKAKGVPFSIPEEAEISAEEVPDELKKETDDGAGQNDGEVDAEEESGGPDRDVVGFLDSLTGCPKPEDILLYALPVCAPYDAMLSYKYKVKLTPGTQKKGKAAKQAIELLSRVGGALPNEVQLLKGVPDPDLMHVLLGSVKISMPGMQKIKDDNKKKKKTKGRR